MINLRANTSIAFVAISVAALGLAGCGDDSAGTDSTTGMDPTTSTSGETTNGPSTTGEPTSAGPDSDPSDTFTGGTTEDKPAECGDGIIDAGEECDNGVDNGVDGLCTAECLEEVVECGDGVVAGDEECDDGADPNCTPDCTLNICGDNYVGGDEQCDDGNNEDGDSCNGDCTNPGCGDGIVQAPEECDLGAGNGDDQACTSMCLNAVCGDGLVGPGETCDDGNNVDDDECTNSCAGPNCGDGILQMAEGEECDDGNDDNTDGCTAACANASCGDGYVYGGVEDCDDGNADNADECTTLCAAPACDDGILSGLEADIDCGGPDCSSCFGLYQHRWKGEQTINSGMWTKIDAADADIKTRGGALEIELSIPLVSGGDSSCRPTIDGEWAGAAQMLPDVYEYHEGRDRTGWNNPKGYRIWRRARVYYDIEAGDHVLGVECRTNQGMLKVGRAESTAVIITREYDGVINKVHQKVTTQGTTMGASGQYVKLPGSELTFDVGGGDIEVSISTSIGLGGHAACMPWMDGAPIPSTAQPYVNDYWSAGLASTYSSWNLWAHSRVYKNITAQTHTFDIRCHNNAGTLRLGEADLASVIIVREIDNQEEAYGQGIDKNNDNGWKVADGLDSFWYELNEHTANVTVTNGNLDVTEWMSYYHVNDGAWVTCRPTIEGEWIGTFAGLSFNSNEEEGVAHQMSNNGYHGTWYRRRVYTDIPPGDHVVKLECLSSGNNWWASRYGQGSLTVRDVPLLGDI
ncbi:MAG: DUF4215 domain-containing protein [Myxococcales bacterium]|nr:DUF4215 domain-containing protein [Myxococcales bacterium]MCB9750612.1 DUF4215 domain-containing protein [Myxococcales bacterium]